MPESSHFDSAGNPHMVDVSSKAATVRVAVAAAELAMLRQTEAMIREGRGSKGDVLGIARIAAIQATKVTSQLIPLCHAIPIESVSVQFDWIDRPADELARLRCTVRVQTTAKTGVEMEAMTAASVASLTVYDMVKSVDRAIVLGPLMLIEKSGGKSGHFRRQA